MSTKVLIVGTLDTKGKEFDYLKKGLEKNVISTIVIDVSTRGEPFFKPDISSKEVASAAGIELKDLREGDRGESIQKMMIGIAAITEKLFSKRKIDGIISMGGGSGTMLALSAMKKVPIGVPKIIITTRTLSNTEDSIKDVIIFHSVTDILGINRISRGLFDNVIGAITGILNNIKSKEMIQNKNKPFIAASMMGVTTDCITKAKEVLEKNGYEVGVFHAMGSGGKTMESLINDGLFNGLLDVTTTEIINRLVGGNCDAGSNRMEAAGSKGIPQVVSCGGIDFVNFYADSIPKKFKNRKMHMHNPMVTLMRSNKKENEKAAEIIAKKLNKAKAPVLFFIPLRGFSSVNAPGKTFYDPEIDKAFIESLKKHIDPKVVTIIECKNHINDPEFANKMAESIIKLVPIKV